MLYPRDWSSFVNSAGFTCLGKRSIRWAIVFAVGVGMSSLAHAQPPAPPDNETIFRSLDQNKDGKLSQGEGGPGAQQMLQRLFQMARKGQSDSISREEFDRLAEQHRRGGGGPGGPGPRNTNNNGPNGRPPEPPPGNGGGRPPMGGPRLTKADLTRMLEDFDRYDTNQDGAIDGPELMEALRGAGEEGPPPPRGAGNRSPMGNRPPGNRPPPRNNESDPPANGSRSTPRSTSTTSGSNSGTRNALAGTWRGWVVDGRGENTDGGHLQMELRIEGNQMTAREIGTNRAPEGLGNGTFTISGDGKSGNLDATGSSGRHDGVEYLGIYEVNGSTLRWCVGNRGRARPNIMETGRGNYLMVLRKE